MPNKSTEPDITPDMATKAIYKRQLRYERALANCSRTLLRKADNAQIREQVLNEALAALLKAASVGRIGLFAIKDDAATGLTQQMMAEATAPGFPSRLDESRNAISAQAWEPWCQRLRTGEVVQARFRDLYAHNPDMLASLDVKSILFCPIFLDGGWWGFLAYGDAAEARTWDEDEVTLLQTAAEIISNVIQRWSLEAELEERVALRTTELAEANALLSREIVERQQAQETVHRHLFQEQTLATLSSRLLQESDFQAAVLEALRLLGTIIMAKRAILFWFGPDNHQPVNFTDWHADQLAGLPPDFQRVLSASFGWARAELDASRVVFCRAPSALPRKARAERRILQKYGIGSMLIVPVKARKRLLGALACTDFSTDSADVDDAVRLSQVVAGMMGSLLQRHELLNLLEARVAARTAEVTAFLDITMLAGEALSLDDILRPALHKVMDISACDAAAIHLLAEDGETLRLAVYSGLPHTELPGEFRALPCGTWWSAAAGPIVVPDLSNPATPVVVPYLPGQNMYVGAVLQSRNKISGLLSCYWPQSSPPVTVDRLTVLVALAEQLGIAVENHRLRQQADEVSATRERQRLARELHDAVAQTLYGLNLFARAGQDALQNNDSGKLQRSLDFMETNALQALKEMRLLLYQMTSFGPGETTDLATALNYRFNEIERRLGIEASLDIEPGIALPAGKKWQRELYLIISEALNNSLKHANASQVQVTINNAADSLRICVQDNGRGFDVSRQHAGMGLQSIQDRVDQLRGRLNITSRPGHGATVCLWLTGEESANE